MKFQVLSRVEALGNASVNQFWNETCPERLDVRRRLAYTSGYVYITIAHIAFFVKGQMGSYISFG